MYVLQWSTVCRPELVRPLGAFLTTPAEAEEVPLLMERLGGVDGMRALYEAVGDGWKEAVAQVVASGHHRSSRPLDDTEELAWKKDLAANQAKLCEMLKKLV